MYTKEDYEWALSFNSLHAMSYRIVGGAERRAPEELHNRAEEITAQALKNVRARPDFDNKYIPEEGVELLPSAV